MNDAKALFALHCLEDDIGIVRDEPEREDEPASLWDTALVLGASVLGAVVLGNLMLIGLRACGG